MIINSRKCKPHHIRAVEFPLLLLALTTLRIIITLLLLQSLRHRVLGVAPLLRLMCGLEAMRSSPQEVVSVEVVKLVEENVKPAPLPVSTSTFLHDIIVEHSKTYEFSFSSVSQIRL